MTHQVTLSNSVAWHREIQNYQLTAINGDVETLFGLAEQDFLNYPDLWFDIMHPGDRGKELLHIRNIYRNGHSVYYYRVLLQDGSEKMIREKAVVLIDDQQQEIAIQGVTTDVTHLAEEGVTSYSQIAGAVQNHPA